MKIRFLRVRRCCRFEIALWAAVVASAVLFSRGQAPGSLDSSFEFQGADGAVEVLSVQGSGRILIGGGFVHVNGTLAPNLARLESTGRLDATFAVETFSGEGNTEVYALAEQADGKILVGGRFDRLGGEAAGHIGRLHPDGTLDRSFMAGAGASGPVRSILVLPSGQILIGGSFSRVQGCERFYVARLHADGQLDETFARVTARDWAIEAGISRLVLQSDGKIVAGGLFQTTGGVSNVARFAPDGSLDASFAGPLPLFSYLFGLAALGDGRVLIGGSEDGGTSLMLRRLNPDRTPDLTFALDWKAQGAIRHFVAQPDGKLILVGRFSGENGPANLARTFPDGQRDSSFGTGTGLNGSALCAALQPSGKLLVGGSFTAFNGAPALNLVRVHTGIGSSSGLQNLTSNSVVLKFPVTAGQSYRLEASTDLKVWSEVGHVQTDAASYTLVDQSARARPHRFFRLLPR